MPLDPNIITRDRPIVPKLRCDQVQASAEDTRPAISLPSRADYRDGGWKRVLVGVACTFLWLPLIAILASILGTRHNGLLFIFGYQLELVQLLIAFFSPIVILAIVVRLFRLYSLGRGFVLGIVAQMAFGVICGLIAALFAK